MMTTNRDLHQVAAMSKNVCEDGLLTAYYAASLWRCQVGGTHPNGTAFHDVLCFGNVTCITLHSMQAER